MLPIPGTYQQVPSNPQKLLTSAPLWAPSTACTASRTRPATSTSGTRASCWRHRRRPLVLIIGGFLGVTMKTGAITAGIAWVVKLKGKEKWMFPVLMTIFAIGGTSYGMAEETRLYALIITVMLAAGYDGPGRRRPDPARRRHRGDRLDRHPFATGIASGFADTTISEGLIGRIIILVIGTALGIFLSCATPKRSRKTQPSRSSIQKAENEKQFMAGGETDGN